MSETAGTNFRISSLRVREWDRSTRRRRQDLALIGWLLLPANNASYDDSVHNEIHYHITPAPRTDGERLAELATTHLLQTLVLLSTESSR
jgi:hypothetical protein